MSTPAAHAKPTRLRLASIREMFAIHAIGSIAGVIVAFAWFLVNEPKTGGTLALTGSILALIKGGIDGAAAHRLRHVRDMPLANLGLGPRMTQATKVCLIAFWCVIAVLILNVIYIAALLVLGVIGGGVALVVAFFGAVAAGPANEGSLITWAAVMKILTTPLVLEKGLISALTSHPIGYVVAGLFGIPLVLAPTALALFFRVRADRLFEATPHRP